jgi:hypothetical protein
MKTIHSLLHDTRRLSLLALLALASSLGCSDGQPSATEETGEAMLSVGTIPEDVACIRVSVVGELRSVVKDFAVIPGGSLAEPLSGLPVGKDVFSANAYSQACESVTKSTAPMWLSDEKTVNVAQGKSTSVTLALYKNGRARVSVEFADQEDGGTDAGVSPDGGGTPGS